MEAATPPPPPPPPLAGRRLPPTRSPVRRRAVSSGLRCRQSPPLPLPSLKPTLSRPRPRPARSHRHWQQKVSRFPPLTHGHHSGGSNRPSAYLMEAPFSCRPSRGGVKYCRGAGWGWRWENGRLRCVSRTRRCSLSQGPDKGQPRVIQRPNMSQRLQADIQRGDGEQYHAAPPTQSTESSFAKDGSVT